MNILVTGGLGFIGSNLVDRLIKNGNEVFVIDDLSTGLESNRNEKAHYYYWDIRDFIKIPDKLGQLLGEHSIKLVYHLAAIADVRGSLKDPNTTYTLNSLSSVAISQICQKSGVEKFIFASTSAVYGEPEYLPVDESHRTEPISPYGLSKLFVEQHLRYESVNCRMSMVVFRFPNVYGPRQRPDLEGGVIAIFNDKMKNSEAVTFYGDGRQTRDWVHVYDIVEALIKTIGINGLGFEIIPLGSGKENSLWDLYNCMSSFLKYKSEPNITKEREGDIKRMFMSGRKAKKLLGWVPKIDLERGITLMEC